MQVGHFCNRNVVVAERSVSVPDAARLMRTHHVGTLVVVDGDREPGQPIGIVTDRDLVIEVLAQDIAPDSVTLSDLMGDELVVAGEDDELLDVLRRMRARGVRRMPVVDREGELIGILALDDILALVVDVMENVAHIISREIGTEVERRP